MGNKNQPFANSCPWSAKKRYLALTLLILFYLFFHLGLRPLSNPDEGRYPFIAYEMLQTHQYLTPYMLGMPFFDKPPLYYWFQVLAYKVFGFNSFSIRFFPALIASLFVMLFGVALRNIFNSFKVSVVSAALLITTPLYFALAHYSDMNMEVTCWISSSLIFFLLGYKHLCCTKANAQEATSNAKYFFYAMYICAAAGFLTKGLIGLVLPGATIAIWIALSRNWRILLSARLPEGLFIVLLIVVPWLYLEQKANSDFLYIFFIQQQFERYSTLRAHFNNVMPWWFYVPVLAGSLGAWAVPTVCSLFSLYKQRRQIDLLNQCSQIPQGLENSRLGKQVLNFCLIWFIFVFIFFSLPQSKLVGYITPALPPLAILTGFVLVQRLLNGSSALVLKIAYFLNCTFMLALAVVPIASTAWGLHLWYGPISRVIILWAAALLSMLLGVRLYLKAVDYEVWLKWTIVSSGIFLVLLNELLSFLPTHRSTFNLYKVLNQELSAHPTAQVYEYKVYTADLQAYLKRPVHLVDDWKSIAAAPEVDTDTNRAVHYCSNHKFESPCEVFVGEQEYRKLWHYSSHPMYTVLTLADLQSLQNLLKVTHVHVVALDKINKLVLVNNYKE